jgi:hypothetical protein
MKNNSIFVVILFSLFTFLSCENDGERFNGSPVGKVPFENVTAVVSTNAVFALEGQQIDFTVVLPSSFRASYQGEVTVEASIFSIAGVVRTAKVIIPAGLSTMSGKISIAGDGGVFDSTVKLKLTAINLTNPVLGKQYTIDSNTIELQSGSSTVAAENTKRARFLVTWENVALPNGVRCVFSRVGSTAVTFKNPLAGTTSVRINNVPYIATFNTNLQTTASNFVASYSGNPVLNASGITLEASNSSVIIKYSASIIPPTVVVTSNNTLFSADRYSTSNMPADILINNQRRMDVYVSEIVPKNGKPLVESLESVWVPGKYQITLGASSASSLEPGITNLKYRISIRLPDNSVKIFSGVYTNISFLAGPKLICTFDKVGYGDTSTFENFVFN